MQSINSHSAVLVPRPVGRLVGVSSLLGLLLLGLISLLANVSLLLRS